MENCLYSTQQLFIKFFFCVFEKFQSEINNKVEATFKVSFRLTCSTVKRGKYKSGSFEFSVDEGSIWRPNNAAMK